MSTKIIMPELGNNLKYTIGVKHITSTIKFDPYGKEMKTSEERHEDIVGSFIKENNLLQQDIINIQSVNNYDNSMHMLVISTIITYRIKL